MPHPNKGKSAALDWIKAHVNEPDGPCLIWPFSRVRGYAQIGKKFGGGTTRAPRIMCELVNGPPPSPKHQAAHSCGKGDTGCIHPKHLEWKTNSGNQLDRRVHGTVLRKRPRILTPAEVARVRALKGVKTQDEIAEMFGVNVGRIEYWHRHDRPVQRQTPTAKGT